MRRVLVTSAAVLALAGCGGGAAQPPAADSSAPGSTSAPTSTEAPDRDVLLLVQLCRTFCGPLQAHERTCPIGTTNLMECGMPLAEGIDEVDALDTRLAGLDRSDPERYEDLDRSIADARDAYDTWQDHTGCGLIYDTEDPDVARLHGQQEVRLCALEASTVGMNLATVGYALRNAAEATP